MISLEQHINESKDKELSSIINNFKNGEDSVISMIVKRIENYDKNERKRARDIMFLTDTGLSFIAWSSIDILNTEIDDNRKSVDLYDGFLNDYCSKKKTKNSKYILGVFIDRCFIPIFDKEAFDKIWNIVNKN